MKIVDFLRSLGGDGIQRIHRHGYGWNIPERSRNVHISRLEFIPTLSIYLEVSLCGKSYSKPRLADPAKNVCPKCAKGIVELIGTPTK